MKTNRLTGLLAQTILTVGASIGKKVPLDITQSVIVDSHSGNKNTNTAGTNAEAVYLSHGKSGEISNTDLLGASREANDEIYFARVKSGKASDMDFLNDLFGPEKPKVTLYDGKGNPMVFKNATQEDGFVLQEHLKHLELVNPSLSNRNEQGYKKGVDFATNKSKYTSDQSPHMAMLNMFKYLNPNSNFNIGIEIGGSGSYSIGSEKRGTKQ